MDDFHRPEGVVTRGVFRDGDQVHVSYDGRKPVLIPARQYQDRGYEPPLNELPTREQYERPSIGAILAHRYKLRLGGDGLA